MPTVEDARQKTDQENRYANGQVLKDDMTVDERRNSWASFSYSLKPAGQVGERAEKCPEAVSLLLLNLKEKQTWYRVWLDCGQSWLSVEATESFLLVSRERKLKAWAWLTESQISDLDKSAAIASGIVKRLSMKQGSWRPHPEVPEMLEAVQSLVMVEDSLKEELERVHSKGLEFTAQLDGTAATRLAAHMQMQTEDEFSGPPGQGDGGGAGTFAKMMRPSLLPLRPNRRRWSKGKLTPRGRRIWTTRRRRKTSKITSTHLSARRRRG